MFVKHGFASLPRQKIQKYASADGPERGHRRVVRHASRVAYGKIEQQKIVNDRKGENRRVQKRDQQKAQAPCRSNDRLNPMWQVVLLHVSVAPRTKIVTDGQRSPD